MDNLRRLSLFFHFYRNDRNFLDQLLASLEELGSDARITSLHLAGIGRHIYLYQTLATYFLISLVGKTSSTICQKFGLNGKRSCHCSSPQRFLGCVRLAVFWNRNRNTWRRRKLEILRFCGNRIYIKTVKHLLKWYFKLIFIILVASKRQTCRFKSSLNRFLFRTLNSLMAEWTFKTTRLQIGKLAQSGGHH